jgi:hypothetical protein
MKNNYILKNNIMPNLNQKGPMGQGAMTGRKMGKCTNFGGKENAATENSEQTNGNNFENGQGRGQGGLGFGRGLGRGRGLGQKMRGGRGMGRGQQNNNNQ